MPNTSRLALGVCVGVGCVLCVLLMLGLFIGVVLLIAAQHGPLTLL
jgi:hypothetical protein